MRPAPERRLVVYLAFLALAVRVELPGQDPRLVARSWPRMLGLASMGGWSR